MFDVIEDEKTPKRPTPKKGMEYIYLLDMVWNDEVIGHIPMKIGSIMIDVERDNQYESRLHFTHKESGERYYCHYGWALAEKTPENEEIIYNYNKANEILKNLESYVTELRNKIIDLD